MAKSHIDKCKFTNKNPMLHCFQQYITSLLYSKKQKAIKTVGNMFKMLEPSS